MPLTREEADAVLSVRTDRVGCAVEIVAARQRAEAAREISASGALGKAVAIIEARRADHRIEIAGLVIVGPTAVATSREKNDEKDEAHGMFSSEVVAATERT